MHLLLSRWYHSKVKQTRRPGFNGRSGRRGQPLLLCPGDYRGFQKERQVMIWSEHTTVVQFSWLQEPQSLRSGAPQRSSVSSILKTLVVSPYHPEIVGPE